MKSYHDSVAVVKHENEERQSPRAPNIGTQRIDIEMIEQLRFRASSGHFSFAIDEPRERGGTGAGLPPLAYFLAGAASCLMTQYAKLAVAKDVTLKSMRTVARGHFDRRVGGAFTDIVYEIVIESPVNEDTIKTLAVEAETLCYAHNTLKKVVRMEVKLTLNGIALNYP